ncbi:hypothetical protein OF83DRAFT_743185 [Amylostereum chailletii]|nr:hypothetical protein OF83DRAFT_743185 [Amylostereum chailletii]
MDTSRCARLPPEILLAIFILLRGCTVPDLNRNHAECMYPIVVTQVCRQWRAVAFDCKELWTCEALCHGLEWTKRALELSKSAPLSIAIFPAHINPELFLKRSIEKEALLLGELHRIEWLLVDIHEADDSERETITTLLNVGMALQMRTLTLDIGKEVFSENISPDIFAGNTPPHLECLWITCAIIPPNFHIFRSPLTFLRLEGCQVWQTIDQFLDTLSSIPTLETFIYSLVDFCDEARVTLGGHPAGRAPHSVAMPNLRFFQITEDITAIGIMMRFLCFRPDVFVNIHGVGGEEHLYGQNPTIEESDFEECFTPWLLDSLPDDCGFNRVSIYMSATRLSLTASNPGSESLKLSRYGRPPPCFKFQITEPQMNEDSQSFAMLHVFLSLPAVFQGPKHVIMQSSCFTPENGHRMLAPILFSPLETLQVGNDAACGYVEALSEALSGDLLPRTALTFKHVNLRATWHSSSGDWPATVLIRQSLGRLSDMGYTTPRVVFKECAITAEAVSVLKHIMPFTQVDVDDNLILDETELQRRRDEANPSDDEASEYEYFDDENEDEDEDEEEEEEEQEGEEEEEDVIQK